MNINEFIENLSKHEVHYMRFDSPEEKSEFIIVPASENNDTTAVRTKTIKFIFKLNEATNMMELNSGIIYKETFDEYIKHFVDNIISFSGEDGCFVKNFHIF